MANPQQPPFIPPAVATPSNEWAQETVGAVHNVAEAEHGNALRQQGHIPGAFPGSVSSRDEQELASTAKQTLENAQKTAKDVYANAGQGAQSVLSSAEQAARQYLPQGVVDRLEQVGIIGSANATPQSSVEQKIAQYDASHHDSRPGDATSLPSHETGSFHPTHGGVGTLPGKVNEAGVAKLPEERTQELRDELPTHETGPFHPTHGGVGSLPGSKDEVGVAELPDEKRNRRIAERDHENPRELDQLRDELPTRERDTKPTHGGVGSLPGERDESGVAVLPEERKVELDHAKKEDYGRATENANRGARDAAAAAGLGVGAGAAAGGLGVGAGAAAAAKPVSSTVHASNPFSSTVPGTQQPTGTGAYPSHELNVAGSAPIQSAHATGPQTADYVPGTKQEVRDPPVDGLADATSATGLANSTTHRAAPPVPMDREYGLGASGPASIAQGGGHGAPPVHPSRKPEGQEAYASQGAERTSTEEEHAKVKLGQKLKAEAKIISGKLSRDAEKVEEGKAMKHPGSV